MRPLDARISGFAHHRSCWTSHLPSHLYFESLIHPSFFLFNWPFSNPYPFCPTLSGQRRDLALCIFLAFSCTCCPFPHLMHHRYLLTAAHHSVRCFASFLFWSARPQEGRANPDPKGQPRQQEGRANTHPKRRKGQPRSQERERPSEMAPLSPARGFSREGAPEIQIWKIELNRKNRIKS